MPPSLRWRLVAFLLLASGAAIAQAQPAPLAIDLDGDGRDETQLSLVACRARPATDCLAVAGPGAATELPLGLGEGVRDASSTDLHLQGPHLVLIGDHAGGHAPEVAILTGERDAKLYHGVLTVVDVQGRRILGRATSPTGIFNVFVDAARGADGRLHPFLAPSFGASPHPAPELGTAGEWDYVCTFTPGQSDPRCGSNFSAIDLGAGRSDDGSRAEDYFREVGGFLQDLDGDGWQDVTLIYHGQLRAISLAKRQRLDVVHYDIARDRATIDRTRFAAVAHSGRNFGTHAAVTGVGGVLRDVMVAGAPVDAFGKLEPAAGGPAGAFRDLYCNVSRFIGVVEGRAGQPGSRHLAWARYFGFDSSTFVSLPQQAGSSATIRPVAPLLSRGDFMDRCLHRFSDSRLRLAGRDLIAVDVFTAGEPQADCLAEQYQLYFDGWSATFRRSAAVTDADAKPWSTVKQRAWSDCKAQNIGRKGRWTLQLYEEATGAPVGTLGDGYVWGWSDRIVPGATVALVERLEDGAPFDFTWDLAGDRARPVGPLSARVLSAAGWRQSWTLPARLRPRIAKQPPRGARGLGDYSYYAELTTADVDGDGLLDVQLSDGSWVGYVRASASFACKRGCAR